MQEFDEKLNKELAEGIVRENMKFETYYINLYHTLKNRVDDEYNLLETQTSKVDFLQKLMDEITEANHNAYNRYNIGEIAEKSTGLLDGLFNSFESRIQKLYNPSPLLRNEYPEIFKDDLSYNIFLKWHDKYYSNTAFHLVNYSFIYYALKKEGFITIKQTTFRKFLDKLDITLDRINAREQHADQQERRYVYDTIKAILIQKIK